MRFQPGHFFSKSFASVCLNVADARSTVGVEQKSEDFSYHIVMRLAGFYVCAAFGTTAITFLQTALSDFTPACLVVLSASRTFPVKILTACSAIQAAGGDVFCGGGDCFNFVFHLYLMFVFVVFQFPKRISLNAEAWNCDATS